MEKIELTPEQQARMRDVIVKAAMAELRGIRGKAIRERHERRDPRDRD